MEAEKRADLLKQFLMSEVWVDVLKPDIEARLAGEIQALVADTQGVRQRSGAIGELLWLMRLGQQDERRGRIKTLKAFLRWPTDSVVQFDLDKARQMAHNEDEARWKFLAEFGHTAPYLQPTAPSEQE